jgi:hypothetical protein
MSRVLNRFDYLFSKGDFVVAIKSRCYHPFFNNLFHLSYSI